MDKLLELLEQVPSSGDTKLCSQIKYIETLNQIIRTPIGIAIANSLKELEGIKKKY